MGPVPAHRLLHALTVVNFVAVYLTDTVCRGSEFISNSPPALMMSLITRPPPSQTARLGSPQHKQTENKFACRDRRRDASLGLFMQARHARLV